MNLFRKLQLKVAADSSAEYKYLKYTERYLEKLKVAPEPNLDFPRNGTITFKHSGNSGDIIYAIPTMKAIAKDQGISLHLYLNRPADYAAHIKHPLGNVTFNQKTYDMMKPLIMSQPDFIDCNVLLNEKDPVDVDLDIMRDYPMLLDRGNIARWYFLVFAVNFDLNQPWLAVPSSNDMNDAIVIARSQRYQAPGIHYRFLRKYPDVYFVGLESEYQAMKKMVPNIQYRPVNDFLELASVIAGSRLFIGNQSFPFSLAEALKVNRLLELYFECPNVNVYGDKGFDFSFQHQFEKLVKERYEGA